MKLFFKLLLGAAIACILLLIGWSLLLASAFGGFDKQYSRQEILDNYQNRTSEITSLIAYYNSIVPTGKEVDVEFDNGDIDMISVEWKEGNNSIYNKVWKSSNGTRAIDSMAHTLGWNQRLIRQLNDKLNEANCISIKNGVPTKIGFQRSGFGIFFYNVFNKPMSDSLRTQYNRGCAYSIHSNKLVLQYGGGAIGPQCFPKN